MARKRRPHWIDELTLGIQEDIQEMKDGLIDAFSDNTPLGYERPPDIKQRVKTYLSMTPQERQAMFVQMGPEGYQAFVDKAMSDLVKAFGAENASRAIQWFAGVGPQAGLSDEESEMAILSQLGQGVGYAGQ